MTANEILEAAAEVMAMRADDYDSPGGERSMARIVGAFNALTGHDLTEAEGWHFMELLKLARSVKSPGHEDSHVDRAAYAALGAEAAMASAMTGNVGGAK